MKFAAAPTTLLVLLLSCHCSCTKTDATESCPPSAEAWNKKWQDYVSKKIPDPEHTPYDYDRLLRRKYLDGFHEGMGSGIEWKGRPQIVDFFPRSETERVRVDGWYAGFEETTKIHDRVDHDLGITHPWSPLTNGFFTRISVSNDSIYAIMPYTECTFDFHVNNAYIGKTRPSQVFRLMTGDRLDLRAHFGDPPFWTLTAVPDITSTNAQLLLIQILTGGGLSGTNATTIKLK